jgi:DNA-binding transcriptional regulator YiaG
LPPPPMRRAIRQAAGVTATDVAREVGVTQQAVRLWERGLRRPAGQHLVAYLKVLELMQEAVESGP